MYWSQTERESWSCNFMFNQPGQPFSFARGSHDVRVAERHVLSGAQPGPRHADEEGARGCLCMSHGLGDMQCSKWSGFCAREVLMFLSGLEAALQSLKHPNANRCVCGGLRGAGVRRACACTCARGARGAAATTCRVHHLGRRSPCPPPSPRTPTRVYSSIIQTGETPPSKFGKTAR